MSLFCLDEVQKKGLHNLLLIETSVSTRNKFEVKECQNKLI